MKIKQNIRYFFKFKLRLLCLVFGCKPVWGKWKKVPVEKRHKTAGYRMVRNGFCDRCYKPIAEYAWDRKHANKEQL